jgi:aryl-alcohol dehydrogenase-like predicted oxidoreductase
MEYISVQGTQKPVSRLIMGSMDFKLSNPETVSEMIDAFISIGGTTIDTAYIYARGESEQAIGRYMNESGNRDQLVILTKGAHHNKDGSQMKKEAIAKELTISLERLQTDHVELYALHRDDPEVPVGFILEWLNEHIESGRIGSIGVSNWTWQRLHEANEHASKHGLKGFTFSSPNLSLAKPKEPFWPGCVSADAATCAWHEKYQIPLLSWSSQARGFFTGRFHPEVEENKDMVRVYYSDDNWERYRRASQLADQRQVSTIQIALAYVLNQPFPTCALIGARNVEELLSCDQGARIRLTRQELQWLDLTAEA